MKAESTKILNPKQFSDGFAAGGKRSVDQRDTNAVRTGSEREIKVVNPNIHGSPTV